MSTGARPLIAIPARFSASAAALRYGADVTARALADAVFAAGGEPVMIHPVAPGAIIDVDAVAQRIGFCDGLLLPGGGDLSPRWTGEQVHPEHYDVDEEQDAFDFALARYALQRGVPLLAICRGLQVVTVALGGRLHAHMDPSSTGGSDHRNRVHSVNVEPGSALADLLGSTEVEISCFHHQAIDQLGAGTDVWARSADGVVEAIGRPQDHGWFIGVQWHPEDTAASDPAQAALFTGLVAAARGR